MYSCYTIFLCVMAVRDSGMRGVLVGFVGVLKYACYPCVYKMVEWKSYILSSTSSMHVYFSFLSDV